MIVVWIVQISWPAYEEEGLWSCSCSQHMHYGLCKHSYLKAMEDDVITGYPSRRDPTKVGAQKTGRPKKSVSGGALGFD